MQSELGKSVLQENNKLGGGGGSGGEGGMEVEIEETTRWRLSELPGRVLLC